MLPAENSSCETVVFDDGPGAFRAQTQDVLVDCLELNSDVRRQREGGIGRRWLLFRLYSLGGARSRKEGTYMAYSSHSLGGPKSETVAKISRLGGIFLRYGLTVGIGWIAAMKVTDYEAKGIEPLIAHSPFLHWGYRVWTVDHFTMIIGAIEMIIAILIALRRWFPLASALGSAGAVLMFLTTLSFIITTPGWEPSLGGFPALSGDVGEFLIKDFVLLGAALWTLAESLNAASSLPTFLRDRFNEGD